MIFIAGFIYQRFLNKDPNVWFDGAKPLPMYVIAQANITIGRLTDFSLGIYPLYM
jgi:hypothetical protein